MSGDGKIRNRKGKAKKKDDADVIHENNTSTAAARLNEPKKKSKEVIKPSSNESGIFSQIIFVILFLFLAIALALIAIELGHFEDTESDVVLEKRYEEELIHKEKDSQVEEASKHEEVIDETPPLDEYASPSKVNESPPSAPVVKVVEEIIETEYIPPDSSSSEESENPSIPEVETPNESVVIDELDPEVVENVDKVFIETVEAPVTSAPDVIIDESTIDVTQEIIPELPDEQPTVEPDESDPVEVLTDTAPQTEVTDEKNVLIEETDSSLDQSSNDDDSSTVIEIPKKLTNLYLAVETLAENIVNADPENTMIAELAPHLEGILKAMEAGNFMGLEDALHHIQTLLVDVQERLTEGLPIEVGAIEDNVKEDTKQDIQGNELEDVDEKQEELDADHHHDDKEEEVDETSIDDHEEKYVLDDKENKDDIDDKKVEIVDDVYIPKTDDSSVSNDNVEINAKLDSPETEEEVKLTDDSISDTNDLENDNIEIENTILNDSIEENAPIIENSKNEILSDVEDIKEDPKINLDINADNDERTSSEVLDEADIETFVQDPVTVETTEQIPEATEEISINPENINPTVNINNEAKEFIELKFEPTEDSTATKDEVNSQSIIVETPTDRSVDNHAQNIASEKTVPEELQPIPDDQEEIQPIPDDQAEIQPIPDDQAELQPIPDDQAEIQPIPDDQADIQPIPDDQEEIQPIPDDQEEIQPIPDDQEEIQPIPDDQAELQPIPDDQEEIQPIPDDQEEIQPIPDDQEEIQPIPDDQEEIQPIPDDQEEIQPIPDDQEEIPPIQQDKEETQPIQQDQEVVTTETVTESDAPIPSNLAEKTTNTHELDLESIEKQILSDEDIALMNSNNAENDERISIDISSEEKLTEVDEVIPDPVYIHPLGEKEPDVADTIPVAEKLVQINEALDVNEIPKSTSEDSEPDLKENESAQKDSNVVEIIQEPVEKEPEITPKEKETAPEVPEIVKEEPEIIEKSPEVIEKEPEIIEKASQAIEKEPEIIEKTPEIIEKEPEVIEKVPEVIEKVPEVIEKVPEVIEKVPEIIEKAPEIIEKAPEIDIKEEKTVVESIKEEPLIEVKQEVEDKTYKNADITSSIDEPIKEKLDQADDLIDKVL